MAPANNNYSTPPPKAKKAAIGGLGKKVELSSQQVPNSRFTQAFQEMKEVLSKFYINICILCTGKTERSGQSLYHNNIPVPKNLDL